MTAHKKSQAASLMGDPSNLGIVYRAVRAAADQDAPAPTNGVLAEKIGANSTATPVRVLQKLAKMGAITLEAGAVERRIAIIATGKRTRVSENFKTRDAAKAERTAAAIRSGQDQRRRVMEEARRRSERRAAAYRETASNPLPIDRPTPVLAAPASQITDSRQPAWSREPCPRCGTRGDLGCTHQRPFQELEPT